MKRVLGLVLGVVLLSGCIRTAGNGSTEAYITRAAFIQSLIKASEIEIKYIRAPKVEEYFQDVKSDAPYAMSLINAVDAGIISPVDKKIGPEEKITLNEALMLMDRAFSFKTKLKILISPLIFEDIRKIEGFEKVKKEDYVTKSMEEKLLSLYAERIKPHISKRPGVVSPGIIDANEKGINVTTSKSNGELVITLDWGEKNTGGYILKILSTREEGDAIIVEYLAKAPGPNDIVTQVITYPKDTKRIKVKDINKDYKIVLKEKID